jgi:hypothetical protein
MASNRDVAFAIFNGDMGGIPFIGAVPFWTVFVEVETGVAATPPDIRELGGGLYAFTPPDVGDVQYVGIIDNCNGDANPRYTTWASEVLMSDMQRVLGMLHQNSVVDDTIYDANNNLLQARMRLYNNKTNADAASAASQQDPPAEYDTGKVGTYSISCSYIGTNLATYEVAKVS